MSILLSTILLFLMPPSYAEPSTLSEVSKLITNVLESFRDLDTHDPYANLTIDEFVNINGYTLETHNVTTEDGYILTLHRIPHGKTKNSTGKSQPVVVFRSGFQSSAWDFLYLGKNKSLAMLLADSGYDIWLINPRGSRFSMNHIKFNSAYNSKQFWNFSFHEKGYYDIPASIDSIINKTNVPNVSLITFSQGTSEALISVTTRPEYQAKINLLVLTGPLAYMANTKSPIIMTAYKIRRELEVISKVLDIQGLPYNCVSSNRPILKNLCSIKSPLQNLCFMFFQEFYYGPDYSQFNQTHLSFYLSNYPAGNSIKELLHYAQQIQIGQFRQFDYGVDNVNYYNCTEPPSYNISSIKTPIAAYYGKNDHISAIADVEKLLKQVPNLVESKLINYDKFNHIDVIWAIDAKTLLYDDIIKQIHLYNPVN